MRHQVKGRKLGTDASHTKAMKKSLAAALLANDRIKTTETRAKEIRRDVDRVITWAKRGDVHSRRLAIAKIGDKQIVSEIFEKVAQGMFAGRNGGYTRIYKLGNRKGDNAPMVIIELVTEAVDGAPQPVKSDNKAPKGRAAKKAEQDEINEKFKFDEDDTAVEAEAEEAADEAVEEAVEAEEDAAQEAAEVTEEAAPEAASEKTEA